MYFNVPALKHKNILRQLKIMREQQRMGAFIIPTAKARHSLSHFLLCSVQERAKSDERVCSHTPSSFLHTK